MFYVNKYLIWQWEYAAAGSLHSSATLEIDPVFEDNDIIHLRAVITGNGSAPTLEVKDRDSVTGNVTTASSVLVLR